MEHSSFSNEKCKYSFIAETVFDFGFNMIF